MDVRLHHLDSFFAQGSDGARYKVRAYERLAPDPALADGEHWEPTGQAEYRLADGRRVAIAGDGTMRIAGTQVVLQAADEPAHG